MASGKDMWASAEQLIDESKARSANAMRFYALNRMLAEAETAMLTGNVAEAAERIRELQAHCEKMIAILVPEPANGPRVVAA